MREWIPMRVNLADDAVVIRISRELSAKCPHNVRMMSARCLVIGALYRLWAMFDQQTSDGVIPGLTTQDVDAMVGVDGFCAAVERCGWLTVEPDGLRIPSYDKWFGRCAKRRLKDAKAKAERRTVSAFRPQDVRMACGHLAEQNKKENKKEKEKSTPIPPCDADDLREPIAQPPPSAVEAEELLTPAIIDAACRFHRIDDGQGLQERTTHLFARHSHTVRIVESLRRRYSEADIVSAIANALAKGCESPGEIGYYVTGVVQERHAKTARPRSRREEAQDIAPFLDAMMEDDPP